MLYKLLDWSLSCFAAESLILMDEQEFFGDPYQRVYQYIRRYVAGQNLDLFSFTSGVTEESMQDCLQLLLQ